MDLRRAIDRRQPWTRDLFQFSASVVTFVRLEWCLIIWAAAATLSSALHITRDCRVWPPSTFLIIISFHSTQRKLLSTAKDHLLNSNFQFNVRVGYAILLTFAECSLSTQQSIALEPRPLDTVSIIFNNTSNFVRRFLVVTLLWTALYGKLELYISIYIVVWSVNRKRVH